MDIKYKIFEVPPLYFRENNDNLHLIDRPYKNEGFSWYEIKFISDTFLKSEIENYDYTIRIIKTAHPTIKKIIIKDNYEAFFLYPAELSPIKMPVLELFFCIKLLICPLYELRSFLRFHKLNTTEDIEKLELMIFELKDKIGTIEAYNSSEIKSIAENLIIEFSFTKYPLNIFVTEERLSKLTQLLKEIKEESKAKENKSAIVIPAAQQEYNSSFNIENIRELIEEGIANAIINNSNSAKASKDDELLKIEDVCKLYHVSKVTVHSWKKNGKIPFHRINSRIYFKKEEILKALQEANIKWEGKK